MNRNLNFRAQFDSLSRNLSFPPEIQFSNRNFDFRAEFGLLSRKTSENLFVNL